MNDFYNPQLSSLQAQLQQLQSLMNQKPVLGQVAPAMQRTIDFVDGEAGARVFLDGMAANTSAAVFDKNSSCFFPLSKDANGTAGPLKRCPFTVEDVPEPGSDTITRADFDAFKDEIRGVLAALAPKEAEA